MREFERRYIFVGGGFGTIFEEKPSDPYRWDGVSPQGPPPRVINETVKCKRLRGLMPGETFSSKCQCSAPRLDTGPANTNTQDAQELSTWRENQSRRLRGMIHDRRFFSPF